MGDGIENAARVAGIRMNRYNNNNDGPTTINNARLMIQDKPDLILEYTGVEGIGAALKKMFGDEKIPFIAINIPIPGVTGSISSTRKSAPTRRTLSSLWRRLRAGPRRIRRC